MDEAVTRLIGENLDELACLPAGDTIAITDCSFKSSRARAYTVTTLVEGGTVFTDRTLVWKQIPVSIDT